MLTNLKNTFLNKNLVSVHVLRHILFAVTIFPSLVFFQMSCFLTCVPPPVCWGLPIRSSGPQSSSGFPGVHLPRVKKAFIASVQVPESVS